eukprot:scaffold44907_cov64-Phaeocystis_antarctica.AAC.7
MTATVGDTAPESTGRDASDADRAGRSCAVAAFPMLRREPASAGWRPDAVPLEPPEELPGELRNGRAPDGLPSRASSVGRARSLVITMYARWEAHRDGRGHA